MTNRPDLIAQLSKLTPTEGVWNYDSFGINTEGEILYKSFESKESDDVLITLAPTMRIAILDMAKEIERLQMKLGLATIELKSYRDKL